MPSLAALLAVAPGQHHREVTPLRVAGDAGAGQGQTRQHAARAGDTAVGDLGDAAAEGLVGAIDGLGDIAMGSVSGLAGLDAEPVDNTKAVRAALAGADDNYSCAGGFQQYLDGAKKPDTPEEAFFCSADRNGFLDGGIFDLVVDRTPAEAKTAQ